LKKPAPGKEAAPDEEMDPEEPKKAAGGGGKPPSYRGPDQVCQFCKHFDEFETPACQLHSHDADPLGGCDDFSPGKEDKGLQSEDSRANDEGEADSLTSGE
jgi:hypothetical protein